MRLVLSRSLADLPVDRAQWNALVLESTGASIFQTHEWFTNWWTAFGGDREPYIVTAWDGESLAGIAPLMRFRRHGLRTLEFIGTPNADYQDFILGRRAGEVLPRLARFLRERQGEWDMIVLRNVPTVSPTFSTLPALMRALGIPSTNTERVACPTLEIASRPEETRRLLGGYGFRRTARRLAQEGNADFRRCSTIEDVEHCLPEFFAQYAARHSGTPSARAMTAPAGRNFYLSLARDLLVNDWLHFSVLECAGRPVAFHFGFEFGDRLYWYKPCFDPALARMSPGTVLLWHLIQYAQERKLRELDFTVGPEAFKYRYATATRVNANVRAFSHSWLYVAFAGMGFVRRNLGALWRWLQRTGDRQPHRASDANM